MEKISQAKNHNKEILDCPFCGGTPLVVTRETLTRNKVWDVSCLRCEAKLEGFYSMEDLLNGWNGRVCK